MRQRVSTILALVIGFITALVSILFALMQSQP
jgi:hypothetical protein